MVTAGRTGHVPSGPQEAFPVGCEGIAQRHFLWGCRLGTLPMEVSGYCLGTLPVRCHLRGTSFGAVRVSPEMWDSNSAVGT